MKDLVSKRIGLALAVLAFAAAPLAHAFSLLGPFAPWMKSELGYHQEGDIGGPMNLGEEYRWTVPVVTYGFDQSFLDYFGQPGVDAVEQAIQILNALPPAAEFVPTAFPTTCYSVNSYALAYRLLDLKTTTLQSLVEQMGLAQSARYVWTLKDWDPELFCPSYLDEYSMELLVGPTFTDYVNLRSYDPVTQEPTRWVNSTLFTFYVASYAGTLTYEEAIEVAVDPLRLNPAVSDHYLGLGRFCTGLTYDDVGGIRYLLSQTNLNVETLEETILPVENTPGGLVRTALRPGVEKLTFIRHATNVLGGFVTMTNRFDDPYFTNGLLATQRVYRVSETPDIVFRAADLGFGLYVDDTYGPYAWFPTTSRRSDTSRWANNAALNGNPGGDGPGVIRPPVDIAFHTPGRYLAATGGSSFGVGYNLWNWASFSDPGNTNVIVFLGDQTNHTSLTLATRTFVVNASPTFEWTLLGRPTNHYWIETSTNLLDWSVLTTVASGPGVFQFTHPLAAPRQFFRAVLRE